MRFWTVTHVIKMTKTKPTFLLNEKANLYYKLKANAPSSLRPYVLLWRAVLTCSFVAVYIFQ